jgi:3-hydroxybutyryl-CoA dehydrogenase
MLHLGMPCGPFGFNDHIGLDTICRIMQTNARISGDAAVQQVADEIKRDYIDKGWLGVKSGRGFYTYPNPAYSRPEFLGGGSEWAHHLERFCQGPVRPDR